MEPEKELQSPRSRREHVSTFRRYRLGWVLLGMIATEVAVVLANGSVAAAIMLPPDCGRLYFPFGPSGKLQPKTGRGNPREPVRAAKRRDVSASWLVVSVGERKSFLQKPLTFHQVKGVF